MDIGISLFFRAETQQLILLDTKHITDRISFSRPQAVKHLSLPCHIRILQKMHLDWIFRAKKFDLKITRNLNVL